MDLYNIMEERIKKAMLENSDKTEFEVSFSDLKARKNPRLINLYSYSPYDWYCFNKQGHMRTSCWIGDYYVLEDGKMARNQWIGKYYVGEDGKWVKGKNKTA